MKTRRNLANAMTLTPEKAAFIAGQAAKISADSAARIAPDEEPATVKQTPADNRSQKFVDFIQGQEDAFPEVRDLCERRLLHPSCNFGKRHERLLFDPLGILEPFRRKSLLNEAVLSPPIPDGA